MTGKWWDKAWSLVDGCTPVSEACDHCWLAQMDWRFGRTPGRVLRDDNGSIRFLGNIRIREDRLDIPLRTRKPTVFAVWSDLHHESIPFDFRLRAYDRMEQAKQHTFIVLTKRPEQLLIFCANYGIGSGIQFPENVYHGITAENQQRLDERLPYLLQVPGKKIISAEPLLGPMDLLKYCCNHTFNHVSPFCTKCNLSWAEMPDRYGKIHGVIVGSESGPHRRETKIEWVEDIVEQCKIAGISVFVKQLSINGKLSKNPEEWPENLRIRALPWRKE